MRTKKQTTANKSSHQKCFFAAQGLCSANREEPRAAIILPYFVHTDPALQQKLAMPLQPHRPPSFCPLSPEAYLLTEKGNSLIH
jgi:hypothetical protein